MSAVFATVLTPEDENAPLGALPGYSKKRTHCGDRPEKTKALFPATGYFRKSPTPPSMTCARQGAAAKQSQSVQRSPNEAIGCALPNETESERSALLPGHSKKRTHFATVAVL